MFLPSSISTRLQYQHKSLMDIIEGLSDEQTRQQVVPGKWSVFENIVHLQTYQHSFIKRIQQVLAENNPSFSRYVAENDPAFAENCRKAPREIIQDLMTTRKEMAAGLLSFTEADLARTGTHPVFGEMTLLLWLNFFLLHEAHHLLTIFKLGAELKKAGGQAVSR